MARRDGTSPASPGRGQHQDEQRWLAGLAVVVACSWGRWLATGSLKVDESYPSELAGTLLLAVLVAGWSLLVVGWAGMLKRPPERPRWLAFVGLGVASLMLPMLSNDVFSLLAYGSLAARGRDVYTTVAELPQSPWYAWIGERWSAKVCVYGPTTLIGTFPAAPAGAKPWLALLALRAAWLVPLVVVMRMSFRAMSDRPLFHTMLWLNPLWLLEGPGQLHADLLGLTAVVAGIVLQRGGGATKAWVAYALAVLGKYTFAFTGFWFWLHGAATNRQRALRVPAIAGVVVALGVVLYAPFWHGPATLTVPVRALSGMNPGGSITEVVGDLVLLARGGSIPSADTPVQTAMTLDQGTSAGTWFAVSLVLRLITLGVGVRALWAMLRKPYDEDVIALGTGVLVVAVATLASHRFEPWYLLPALPFFGLRTTAVWQRWWVIAVAASVGPTFIHVLPKTAALLPIWGGASTAVSVIVFVLFFRGRYGGDLRVAPSPHTG